MKKAAVFVFRLLAPLLIAQQVALPLQAYAQTTRITVNSEDMQRKLDSDVRARDNASGARRTAQPSAPPTLTYGNAPAGWTGQRAPTAAEQALDARRAAEAANKYFPADSATTLNDAQRSNEVARGALSSSGVRNYSDQEPVQRGRNSNPQGFSYHELFPGYSSQESQRLFDSYGYTYENQEALKNAAEYNAKNRLLRNGCQRTEFEVIEKLNLAAAFDDRAHRVLSITFLNYTKTDIAPAPGATEACIRNGQPSTCPAKPKEQYDITPATYQGGQLKMSVAVLGSASNSWTDFVDNTRLVQYDYNPFTFNEKLNYFPFRVKVLYKIGGVVQEAPNAVVNNGTPGDRWTPVIAWTPPVGTQQVVLVADIYKTTHHYDDPQIYGGNCPPIPPVSCSKLADDGTAISWCSGTASANIVTMFSSTAQPDLAMKARDEMVPMFGNLSRNEAFLEDPGLKMGALTGINATAGAKAAALSGACYRVPASRVAKGLPRKGQETIDTCSRRIVSAFEPNGVNDLKRQFGASQLAQHQFLQVRAWNKVKVAIPLTNPVQYTYQLQAANVTGSIDINQFPVMGPAQCNATCKANPGLCNQQTCTMLPPADQEGYYLEYVHTPFADSPTKYGVSAITPNGGTASITHFGRPSDAWRPVGSSSGGGVSQMTFAATIQMVTVNEISGADTYLKMLRDGMCKQPTISCTDERSSVTSGSLTFGPGMATDGFIDLLKPWIGARATPGDFEEGDNNNSNSGDAVIDNQPSNMGLPAMCWGATGGPLLECGASDPTDVITEVATQGGTIKWASDCETKTVAGGKPITSCQAIPSASTCSDERRIGAFSAMCYDEVRAYNCSEPPAPDEAVESEAFVEYCTGTMRCMGTECHRPNLSGMQEKSFAEAAGAMEAVNHMKYDMVCAETGEPPASVDQPCTLRVFAGKQMYCSYAVGAGKAMTTATLVDGNCCRETKEKLGPEVPSWDKYMQAYYITKKLGETEAFKNVASQTGLQDAYNSISSYFGEARGTVTGTFNSVYDEAASFVTQNISKPISSALDGMFGSAGAGTGATPATTAVDALGKMDTASSYFSSLSSTVSQFKQQMLDVAFEFVKEISPDLASTLFSVDAAGKPLGLSQGVQQAFAVWSMARLVVSIVFACKSIEYEWAMNDKWRLCSYAGTCCGRKIFLLGCIQNRDLYCCYKSIVAKVIATEIIRKGLVPGRNGYEKRKCTVNCAGFTIEQLGQVDWGQVDLTEAVTAMVDSGILNPNNPQARYGAQGNSLSTSNTLGADTLPAVDSRVAGDKTADQALTNANSIFGFGNTLQGQEQCYNPADPNKMPFSNPDCDD